MPIMSMGQEEPRHRCAAHLPFPARLTQLHRNKRVYSSWEHLKGVSHLLGHVLWGVREPGRDCVAVEIAALC